MSAEMLALVSKVIQRAMEKSGQAVPGGEIPAAGVISPTGAPSAAEPFVDTLASHLLNFLGMGASPAAQPTSDLEAICTDQMTRNRVLARALGACVCWGELKTCETCRGQGASGWRPPEPEAFDRFVRPVLRKMRQHRHPLAIADRPPQWRSNGNGMGTGELRSRTG